MRCCPHRGPLVRLRGYHSQYYLASLRSWRKKKDTYIARYTYYARREKWRSHGMPEVWLRRVIRNHDQDVFACTCGQCPTSDNDLGNLKYHFWAERLSAARRYYQKTCRALEDWMSKLKTRQQHVTEHAQAKNIAHAGRHATPHWLYLWTYVPVLVVNSSNILP